MSFVLSGLAWWRQLKQTHDPSGAGVINCHMWMNKGAILKPFVVFVNVFHLSLKRPNDFVVSWCMWLVALQNEGNSSQLYISIHFPECLVFSFGGRELAFSIRLLYICKQNSQSQLKHSTSFHSHPHNLHVMSFFIWKSTTKTNSEIFSLCEIKDSQLYQQ